MSSVPFLSNFKERLEDLARYMTLETYLGRKTIVEQGSEGDKFYFILDGKVSIFIKAFNDMTGVEFSKLVTDLSPGSYFGELSLIYNAPRTATVVSCERADLVVISRYAYEKIIRDFHIDQMDRMITFYMNFPLFEDLSKELVFTLVTRTRHLRVQTREAILKQGEQPKMVYFIKAGQFKVVKEVEFKKNKPKRRKVFSLSPKGRHTLEHFETPKGETIVEEEEKERRFLELDTLDAGDVFGHCQAIDKIPMDHSVVCQLPAEIYAVPVNDFLMLCKDLLYDFKRYNKPYHSEDMIKALYDQEQKWEAYKEYLVKNI